MDDRRQFPRTLFHSDVKVTHPSIGTLVVSSYDVSDGGLFLLMTEAQMPPMGSTIELQALAFGDEAPVLKATVVRKTEKGIGLRFELEPE